MHGMQTQRCEPPTKIVKLFGRRTSYVGIIFALSASLQPFHARAAVDRVAAVFSYERPDSYGTLVTKDILVAMRDGFNLTCDLYQPSSADGRLAVGQFPSFVKDYTGYGRRDNVTNNTDFLTQTLAGKGYNVIWCNTRGSQGRNGTAPAPLSVAQVQPWSEMEQQDNYDLIEWLASQPWSNGKVGQTGTSYGGISTWLVAANQKPPHLAAIVPTHASVDNYRHFTYPGGIKSSDLRGLWPELCSGLTGEPTCTPRVTADFQSHPTFDAFWSARKGNLPNVTIPTLYLAGQMDIFAVSTDPIVAAMKNNRNFSMVYGPWQHENVWTTTNAPIPLGVLLAFFDRWLGNNISAPILPKFSAYQSPAASGTVDNWKGFSTWPPADANPQRWSLSPDGSLSAVAKSPGLLSYAAPVGSLAFETDPFTVPKVIAGPLDVFLKVAVSASDANLFVRVDDVDAAGTVVDMGYGGQVKLSHRDSDATPTPIVSGILYTVKLQIPSKFWKMEAGHRLRLTVKSFDQTSAEVTAPTVVTVTAGQGGSYVDGTLWTPAP